MVYPLVKCQNGGDMYFCHFKIPKMCSWYGDRTYDLYTILVSFFFKSIGKMYIFHDDVRYLACEAEVRALFQLRKNEFFVVV